MSIEMISGVVFGIWIVGWGLCLANAYLPDRPLTPRTKARLILTGWFFPIAAPIWLVYVLVCFVIIVVTGLYNTVRTAFSRD